MNTASPRWYQFTLRGLLLMAFGFALVLGPVLHVWRTWRERAVEIVAVRVTSSGTVRWGSEEIPVASMKPHLKRQLTTLTSHGFTPRLEVESYSNTSPEDVRQMVALGEAVGFAKVTVRPLSWPDESTYREDAEP